MKRIQRASQLLFLLCLSWIFIAASSVQASPFNLTEWGFNYNGTLYTPSDPLPGTINHSGFDWNTGLGTITVSGFGAGSNTFHAFFDHDIDEPINTFFNEYGYVSGTPATGQSWEIDEPGYGVPDPIDPINNPPLYIGDIHYNNLVNGSLDNKLFYDGFTGDYLINFENPVIDDIAMAMGWGFTLNSGETASINLVLGTVLPSGFYLSQTDPDSNETIYFSSTLNVFPVGVPEPGTLLLIGTGIVSIAALRCRLF